MHRYFLAIPTFFLCLSAFSQKKTNQAAKKSLGVVVKAAMQKNLGSLDAQYGKDAFSVTMMVAAFYKNIGLQPIIDSSSYVQSFNLDLGKEIKPATTIKINGITLENGNDYWPFAFCPNGFFAGTAVWDAMQTNEPYLYDLKPILEKNKNFATIDLLKHLRALTSELVKKNVSAVIVYNSSDINDSLAFLPNDTADITTIPIIYFTNSGIKKLKNESTIANAIDAKIVLGEKLINGNNVLAYINNGAINTVVIAASNNNVFSTAANFELAKLLNETCHPAEKNITIFNKNDYANNNYLFVNFDDTDIDKFGSDYFLSHLPFNITKINYTVYNGITGAPTDTSNYLKIDGIKSSQAWYAVLKKTDDGFYLRMDSTIDFNLNSAAFYKNNIPVLYLYNPTLNIQNKFKNVTINNNDVKTIYYIMQLIGSANNVGKLLFDKNKK